jgi:inosine-uridine nucleoside N-ribohydrolase
MAKRLVLDVDPGLGDSLATIVALLDPEIELMALTAVAGSMPAPQASYHVQALLQLVDPARWPRIGAAVEGPLPESDADDHRRLLASLNGSNGLADLRPAVPDLHNRRESPRVLVELVREFPHEVTLVTLGPLTNVALACDRAPDFLELLGGLVILGGASGEGGDVTAAAEFNIFHDPVAASRVLSGDEPRTLIPLEATAGAVLTIEDCHQLTQRGDLAGELLRKIVPAALRRQHEVLGVEGWPIREVAAVAAVSRPYLFKTRRLRVDVETTGELTRGMTVMDRRRQSHAAQPGNTNVVIDIDLPGLQAYLMSVISSK